MKKHCSYCRGFSVKRNGYYGNGRQRWFCYNCKRSFHWSNKSSQVRKQRVWFERWIKEGYSIRQLEAQSGYGRKKLHGIIDFWLTQFPGDDSHLLSNHQYTILDGTFLYRPVSLVALMDAQSHHVISGEYGLSENSEPQMLKFLQPLKEKGLSLKASTTDGNIQLIRVLRRLWPKIIIQRCLVHIQRQGLSWCRRNPKRTDAKHLRDIFLQVTKIHTEAERDQFIQNLQHWEQRYGLHIQNRPETGWVFSDLKRARSMLFKALPDMFHYLQNPNIPTSTNGLEGYFSRLKMRYRNHRGLAESRRPSYFKWHFYLCPT